MRKIKIAASVFILLGGLFSNLKVGAFDAEDMSSVMTISPPQQKIVLVPGDTFNGSVTVSNPGAAKTDLRYSATVGSFGVALDENGNPDYNDIDVDTITRYNQMVDWIKLGKDSGVVSPNSEDVIPFTIDVPYDAPAGGQYATIIIQDDTTDNDSSNAMIKTELRFASSIIAEVAGETKNVGKVLENSIPAISFSSPLTVSSLVRNDGNIHTGAEYTLQVFSPFSGEEVYSNEDQHKTSLVLPGLERYNVQEWKEAPMVGIFLVRQTVSIFGDVSVVERIVVLCPLWLLFIIIAAILLVIFWIVSKSRNRKKS